MDAQTVNQEIEELAGLARSELIDVLARAAEDDDVWTKAATDVKGFLRDNGVEVADSAEIFSSTSSFGAVRSNVHLDGFD
jgi:hypothetical protein